MDIQSPELGQRIAKELNVPGSATVRGVDEVVYPVLIIGSLEPTAGKARRFGRIFTITPAATDVPIVGITTADTSLPANRPVPRVVIRRFMVQSSTQQLIDICGIDPSLFAITGLGPGSELAPGQPRSKAVGFAIAGQAGTLGGGPNTWISITASVAVSMNSNDMLDGAYLDPDTTTTSPGQKSAIIFSGRTINTTLTVSLIWEELPLP